MSIIEQPTSNGNRARSELMLLVTANAIVFASSMCIMTLELVASRLVAKHLGSSLYTWTSVIGVILGGISVGNYLGGRLADRYSPRRTLGWQFLAASILSLSVLWLNHLMDEAGRPDAISWPMWILASVTTVFFLPACMLGTISPVVAKMALEGTSHTGATVGNLYAWGAVGSIVGTFLTGFVLISWMGTRAIVCSVSGGLAVLALLFFWRRGPRDCILATLWIVLVAGVSIPAAGSWPPARRLGLALKLRDDKIGELQRESNYATITVKSDPSKPKTKVLLLDNLVHSLVSLDNPARLEYPYSKIYAAVTERLVPRDRRVRAFFIGGGGFVFPRYLESVYSCDRLDVAEIDPMVKWVSHEELALPPDDETQITTYLMDARNFVEDRVRENEHAAEPVVYDFVYGDAFNDFNVPYHLLTKEFNDDIARIMAPEGAYLVNFVDIHREGFGRCLGAYVNTLLLTFPNVYVFSTERLIHRDQRHTFVILCAMQTIDLDDLGRREGDREFPGALFAYAEGDRWQGEMEIIVARGRQITLTDDYAPVDNLLAPVFQAR